MEKSERWMAFPVLRIWIAVAFTLMVMSWPVHAAEWEKTPDRPGQWQIKLTLAQGGGTLMLTHRQKRVMYNYLNGCHGEKNRFVSYVWWKGEKTADAIGRGCVAEYAKLFDTRMLEGYGGALPKEFAERMNGPTAREEVATNKKPKKKSKS